MMNFIHLKYSKGAKSILLTILIIFAFLIFLTIHVYYYPALIITTVILILSWRHKRSWFYSNLFFTESEHKALIKHSEYIVKYANDMIFLLDTEASIIEVSNKACTLLGYSREELLTMNARNLRPQELRIDVKELIRNLEPGNGKIYETEYIRKDGTRFPVEVSIRLFHIDGKLYLQSISRDISDRLLKDETLRISEERYRTLFENNPNPMWVYDVDTLKFITVNEAAIRHYGYSREEFLSMTLLDIRPEEDIDKLLENISSRTEVSQNSGGWRHKKKNGSIIFVEISSYALSVFREKKTRLVTVKDITEQKAAQDALNTEREQLLSIFGSIDEVIYVADMDTHEILYANEATKKIFGSHIVGEQCYYVLQGKTMPCDFCTNKIIKEMNYRPYFWEFHNPVANRSYQIIDRMIKWTDGRDVRFELAVDVTATKEAEQVLRESEERYRALVNKLPDFVLVVVDEKIAFVNNIALEMSGYSLDDLIGESVFKFINPDSRLLIFDKIKRYARNEEIGDFEIELLFKNGIARTVSVKSAGITYNKKDATLVVMTDITESKLAQNALEESEKRYRNIFESSPIGIYRTTPSGKIILANPALVNMLEFSSFEELKKINLEKRSYAKDYTRKDFIEKIERDGKVIGYESAWHKKNNSIIFVRENATVIKDAVGNTLYYEGTVENITEQKFIQEELQKHRLHLQELVDERTSELKYSEERFRALAENSYDIIIRLNSKLELVYVNPIFERLSGFPPGAILGKKIRDIGMPTGVAELEAAILKVFETKELNRYEMQLPNRSWFDWAIIPEFDSNGNVLTIVLNGRDITERINLEESIKNALENEKVLNEMKTKFISTASHEFRTPLTTVLSSAELLERYGRKWKVEKYDEHISNIKNSVDYLTQLINDVLTIGRTETGKIELNLKQLDFYEFCLAVIKEITPLTTHKHKILFKYLTEQKYFFLDEKLLRFILINLLTNAIKYSPKGGKIEMEADYIANQLIIKICDEGIGISEKDQKVLFEPFHRGSNIQNIPGTGLGLSIVKKSVELLKGKIEIESNLNYGSTFTIFIPAEIDYSD